MTRPEQSAGAPVETESMSFEEVQRALGAYPEPQTHDPTDLLVILTFGDAKGQEYRITAAELLRAFLALDREGLIPDPGDEWRAAIAGHLTSDTDPSDDPLARYVRLERVADGMCDCCGAVCHAIFQNDTDEFRIERWAVVTSVVMLRKQQKLHPLPFEWNLTFGWHYEQIRETGRSVYRTGKSGSEDV